MLELNTLDLHFIQKKVFNKDIVVKFINTHNQNADMFISYDIPNSPSTLSSFAHLVTVAIQRLCSWTSITIDCKLLLLA
jgi:hypothetical protein